MRAAAWWNWVNATHVTDSRMPRLPRFLSRFQWHLTILSGIMVTLSAESRAESPYLIDLWTPYEGLPQSRVLSIAQTPDGYLWISTQLGWIARFDGLNFDQFDPTNTSCLLSPEIQKLFVDENGVLWICDVDGRLISYSSGSFRSLTDDKPGYQRRVIKRIGSHGGENRFLTASGMLLRAGERIIYENENNPSMSSPLAILQFCQEMDGTLWCRTHGGALGRWVDGAFQPTPHTQLPAGIEVNHLLAMPEGGLWMATNEGLWKYENGSFSRSPLELPVDHKSIDHLALNPDGSLWILANDCLSLIRDGAIVQSTELVGLGAAPKGNSNEIHTDSSSGAWILGFGRGVWHVDSAGTLTVLNTVNGLPSNMVESWFEDREKNIWLGTAAGLVRLRPRWFRIIDTIPAGAGSGIVSISQDVGGDMWLGRANGLTRWHDGIASDVPLPLVRKGFPIADVTIAPGEFPGDVWLGTVQSGAFLLRDGSIKQHFPYPAPGLAIRVIRRDPDGDIWFGGEFGLFRWNGTELRKFGPEDGLNPGHIHDISFDEQGVPWVAKADDLLQVYRDGRFETIPLPGVSHNLRIHTVLCGSQDNVWLGTVGAGLIHLSRGKVFAYTRKDGLPSDSVTQLLEGDDGYLWGGTLQGIFRVSTTALDMRSKGVSPSVLFQNYDHSDGLPTAECSGGLQPACWKANDGKLWFSTSTSAVVVDPRQVRINLTPPDIIIERMRVNGLEIENRPTNGSSTTLEISPGRHRYEFEFTGLCFTAPEKVRFQWQLDGVDSDWAEGGKQRSVAYSGLEPGRYQFAVRASNNDGVWSREPATIIFSVTPYFWQRTGFRIASALVFLGMSYFLITGIMRRKHLREMRFLEFERSLEQQRFGHEAAMEAERARIAAELHDDLGANLTQIQWLGESAIPVETSSPADKEVLLRISRKSREMVSLIDQIVWSVNPKNDTLEQLVTYICNFAEQYFRDCATRCRIDIPGDIPHWPLKADVRHHLFLIAKEALHNVAKHAATDRVWLHMTCEDGLFRLVIEDRGRGFDTSAAACGDGLINMKNRAQQAGARLEIESTPDRGTQITLSLEINSKPS